MTIEPEPELPQPDALLASVVPLVRAGRAARAFSTRLVNPPNRDPALLVCLLNFAHDYLFDCGTLNRLSNHEKLRIKRVFITHAHIDHMIGLDQLLRSLIYRPEGLEIYGPSGIVQQVYHRLQSYAWNLTGDSPFIVHVHELAQGRTTSQSFPCSSQFLPSLSPREVSAPANRLVLAEGSTLGWMEVSHGVACLAYTLEWPEQQTFLVEQATSDGLTVGPWIRELKQKLSLGLLQDELLPGRTVQELGERYLLSQPGEKLAYVTDTLLDPEQSLKLRDFVRDSAELWCECNYLERDQDLAEQNLHATVTQAALLARSAEVRSLRLFHISRRYAGDHLEHLEEARRTFPESQLG